MNWLSQSDYTDLSSYIVDVVSHPPHIPLFSLPHTLLYPLVQAKYSLSIH